MAGARAMAGTESESEGNSVIKTILRSIEIVSKIPGVTEAIKRIGINVAKLFRSKEAEPEVGSPLERIIRGQNERLQDLIDKFYELDKVPEYDEIEKDKYRKRVAAETCKLLKQSQPIKNSLPDYEKLIELFCVAIPGLASP